MGDPGLEWRGIADLKYILNDTVSYPIESTAYLMEITIGREKKRPYVRTINSIHDIYISYTCVAC